MIADGPSCVAQPLLWIALGARGKDMLAAVEAQLQRLDRDDAARVRCVQVPASEQGAAASLSAALPDLVDGLFSAPRGSWTGLDVVVLADLAECEPRAPGRALHAVLACLEGARSGLVRTRGPASERGLYCHGVFDMPAPSDPQYGSQALAALDVLEHWHRSLASDSPLARLWCWPRRGPLGALSAGDLTGILPEFALALFMSGVRTSDAVRPLLEVRDPREGRVALLSASALSLAVRRVEQYLEARLLLLALESIARSAGGSAQDADDVLLRETELQRLRDDARAPRPFVRPAEQAAADALDAVDGWVVSRIGPQMGVDRLPQVEAALAHAEREARERVAELVRLASELDAAPAERSAPMAATTELASEHVPRSLVWPVAGATLSATAALCLQLSEPPNFAWLWRQVLFPAACVSALAAIAWLVAVKLLAAKAQESERRSRAGLERAGQQAGRAAVLAEHGRFSRALARGLAQRSAACRRLTHGLEASLARFRARLATLGVAPGKTPKEDTLDGLLPSNGRRVSSLCSAADVSRLVEVPDISDWIARVLATGWPGGDARGLLYGEAFGDDAALRALVAQQPVLRRVRERSPFDWTQSEGVGLVLGDWLLRQAEQLVPSHDLTTRDGHTGLPRQRLVFGPPEVRTGQQSGFAELARNGWSLVTTRAHGSLVMVDSTLGATAAQLRSS